MEEARATAAELGYPVMLKAAAGGGGKGMRLVAAEEELAVAFATARSEAQSAFGDASVYLEKAVARPRHIEIQVFADAHGNCVHLGERECSIQRRHQKVIEECPSPIDDPSLRAAMGAAAVRIARAALYVGAGTVEFLVSDVTRDFDKLQVPVLALIPGFDEKFLADPANSFTKMAYVDSWETLIPKHPKVKLVKIPDARLLVLKDQPKLADDAIATFVEQAVKAHSGSPD